MKRNTSFVGLSGLIIFTFGLLTYFLVSFDEYFFVVGHLGLGALLLIYFAALGGLRPFGKAAVRRAAGFSLGMAAYSVIFIALLALVNIYVSRHDPLYFDSTEQKIFTLAPQTTTLLEKMEPTVIIRGFFIGGEAPVEVSELIKRMRRITDKIDWRVVDPETEPTLTESLGISEKGTLHFSIDGGDSNREVKVVRTLTEQTIVNALIKLTRGGKKVVYYVAGHGESDLEESTEAGFLFLKEAIQGENLDVKKLLLAETGKVPDDASALLLMAPRRSLLPIELRAVKRFLSAGGRAILASEPRTSRDVAQLAKPMGIEVGDDIILDQVLKMSNFLQGESPGVGVQPTITKFAEHAVTKGFDQGIVLSTVNSVRKSAGSSAIEIAFSGERSWAEQDVDLVYSETPQATLEDRDIRGPVSIAAAYEGTIRYADEDSNIPGSEDAKVDSAIKPARVFVIGDADFVANVNIRHLFNRDFFLNALNWVLGEEDGVTIRAKTLRASTKSLSDEQFQSIFFFTAIVIPEVVVLSGFFVFWRRKRES
jgi:hypothetical protein